MTELLRKLNEAMERSSEPIERALGFGYVLQIFYLLNRCSQPSDSTMQELPEAIRRIKDYVDAHFAEFSTVNEMAASLFYSREYVSRLFRQYLNTTVSDYIRKRRIAMSRDLIAEGIPVA